MISLFEKNLKRAKQELTDLKTAHERGLGTIRFYRYSVSFSVSSMTIYRIAADVVSGETGRPLAIVLAKGSSHPAGVQNQIVRSGTSQVTATIACYYNDTATVDIISSSMLENITWSAT